MKRAITTLLAAIFVLSAVPAFPDEKTTAGKDECLLVSKNCVGEADDIVKRVHKLHKEIKKGSKVYTAEELKKLQQKLDETDQLLKEMTEGGGGN
ncbi:hypothetical protein GMSM_00820 [Geomonas sp. Red276]